MLDRPALASLICLLLLALLLPVEAHAQAAATINAIPDTFQTRVAPFVAPVRASALSLFGAVAVIGVCFALYDQINGGGGLADILRTILRQGIMIGFWYWLLINGGFFSDIINGVAMVANNASTAGGGSRNLSPGDMAGVGINIVNTLWNATSRLSPVTSAILVIAGCAVLAAFVYITCRMIEIIVESFLFAVLATFILAFGGSAFTREIAIATMRLALAIGLKRFMLQLLVGVGEALMRGWAEDLANRPTDYTAVISIIFCSGMMWMLCMKLPQRAGDVVMGAHTGGYGTGLLGTVKAAMATAAKAGIAAAGGGAATSAAFSLASKQLGASPANSGVTARIGRAAQLSTMAVRNAGQAAASDVGRRLTGGYAANHGSMPWRMAAEMRRQAKTTQPNQQNQNP